MNTIEVNQHYGTSSLTESILAALASSGLADRKITPSDISQLDQFHVRGLAATQELASKLDLDSVSKVLDVGCGLGGAARFLASKYGCHVIGIDLSQSYIDAANLLSEHTGLADKTKFHHGDATHLPFHDCEFDVAWTQHVAMNISDRGSFYTEIFRVLKPDGQLAIYDIVEGNGAPLIYPVPWASHPGISHLVTLEKMTEALSTAGFVNIDFKDTTDQVLAWFAKLRTSPSSSTPSQIGIGLVMGPGFQTMALNLATNIMEGKAKVIQMVAERP